MTLTKQQQLEFAAKHIEKWKSGYDFAVVEETTDGHLYVRWPSICTSGITKKEWQQERDKMSSKPEVDNSWHERGELPPVGCECSAMCDGKWVAVEVLRHRVNNAGMNVAAVMNCTSFNVFWATDFRPLRTERERAIDTLVDIICAGGYFTRRDGGARKIAERIYDAGLLK